MRTRSPVNTQFPDALLECIGQDPCHGQDRRVLSLPVADGVDGQPGRLPYTRSRLIELLQRCLSRVRMALAIDVSLLGLTRALRKIRQALSRAKARSTGERSRACARLTAFSLTVSSRSRRFLTGVAKVPPVPWYALSARAGIFSRSQMVTMSWVRAAVMSAVRPGRAGDYQTSSPTGLVTAWMFMPCLRCLPE